MDVGSVYGEPIVTQAAVSAVPSLHDGLSRLGYTAFRPGQERAIQTLLKEGRLLYVAPTGGGKSLVYQLPAVVLQGTTLVVSPLVALMQDQVHALTERGVPATFLASTLGSDELDRRMEELNRQQENRLISAQAELGARIANLRQDGERSDQTLQQQLMDMAATLQESISHRSQELLERLNQTQVELRDSKADRKILANLLDRMATELNQDS